MSYEVDGAYDFYVRLIRRARVLHRCSACGLSINPGERYAVIRVAWDGQAETIKRCGRCEVTFLHLEQLGWERGTYPDERLNCGMDYAYEWDAEPPEEIQAVVFATAEEASEMISHE